MEITQEYLKKEFSYNPDTGWFVSSSGLASRKNYKGYILFKIKGKDYRAHRLIWFYVTGKWPKAQIDHENNVKHDNRWINLREANNQLNHYNLLKPKNNTSGAKGVRIVPSGRFEARIKHNQKTITIGFYKTLEEASNAYLERAKQYAKEFANKG